MPLLIENCAILTSQAELGYQTKRFIVINGNTIESISDHRPEGDFEAVLSGHNRLAIPGLVNAHTHSPENFIRGSTEQLTLEPWLVYLQATCGLYSARDHYLSTMIGAIEMIKTGTTAVLDHFWSPKLSPDILAGVMQAYQDSGLRAAVAPLYGDARIDLDFGINQGYDTLADTAYALEATFPPPLSERLALLDDFFKNWHQAQAGRLRCMVGPTGLQWSSEELLQESLALTRRYGSGFHMHLLETRLQKESCHWKFGISGIEWLAQRKLLGSEMSLSHSVWVTPKELELIAEAGACLVHNPLANLKLGSGLAPIPAMLKLGGRVALGTDGAASNDNQVLFEAIRMAALIHNDPRRNPKEWLSAQQSMYLATEGGAYALGLTGKLGRLESGYLADITLLDLSTSYMFPMTEAYKQLVFCDTGRSVATVIIDGTVVMQDGQITLFDEQAILAEAREAIAGRLYRHPQIPAHIQADMDKFTKFSQDINNMPN